MVCSGTQFSLDVCQELGLLGHTVLPFLFICLFALIMCKSVDALACPTLFPPCGFQKSNPGHQCYQQVSLQAEMRPVFNFLWSFHVVPHGVN